MDLIIIYIIGYVITLFNEIEFQIIRHLERKEIRWNKIIFVPIIWFISVPIGFVISIYVVIYHKIDIRNIKESAQIVKDLYDDEG